MKPGRPPQFTVPVVRLIRRKYDEAIANGERPRFFGQFARRYGVHSSSIRQVAHRQTYRWVQP